MHSPIVAYKPLHRPQAARVGLRQPRHICDYGRLVDFALLSFVAHSGYSDCHDAHPMAFICLLCRQVGHKTADCPEASRPHGTVVPGLNAAVFPGIHGVDLSSGHFQSVPLCSRCADLKLLDLLLCEDVKDEFGPVEGVFSNKKLAKARTLGPFRSIELLDTCPLCRMLFGAFPPEDADVDPESSYSLWPIPTCNLTGASIDRGESDFLDGKNYTDQELDALRQAYSVLVYIVPADADSRMALIMAFHRTFDDRYQTFFGIAGPHVPSASCSILSRQNRRTALAPRPRANLVDFDLVNSWLHKCDTACSDCQGVWRHELLTTRMLDVVDNKLVDCPPHCRYAALSYVWGGVVPEPDALDKGTLPPTIMDAMEVTRRIGVRYLWVDALCIDQRPTAQKMQQIRMMDLIYEGAYVTILALHGDSSLYGLPGVTCPEASHAQAAKQQGHSAVPMAAMGRVTQPYELVDGYPMAVTYPGTFDALSSPGRAYVTRAWTMQEQFLSRRQLIFDREQVHFNCEAGGPREETIDDAYDPAHMMSARTKVVHSGKKTVVQLQHNMTPPQTPSRQRSPEDVHLQQMAMSQFTELLKDYTCRDMADASDSLNAISGLVSYTERSARMQPFVWGLPLRDYPLTLAWLHERNTPGYRGNRDTITRRHGFPSWSYTGWEGKVGFPASEGPKHLEPDLIRHELVERRIECGMAPVFVGIGHVGTAPPPLPYPQVDGKVLTLKGYTVRFEIKSEPFDEAYLPATDVNIGRLLENNYMHPLTLPSGVFDFVVVCRIKHVMHTADRLVRHTLYLIMLDYGEAAQNWGIPSRRTHVRWTVDKDFVKTDRYNDILCYKEDIRII